MAKPFGLVAGSPEPAARHGLSTRGPSAWHHLRALRRRRRKLHFFVDLRFRVLPASGAGALPRGVAPQSAWRRCAITEPAMLNGRWPDRRLAVISLCPVPSPL